jgi:integrase
VLPTITLSLVTRCKTMPRFQEDGKPTLMKHAEKERDTILRPVNDGLTAPTAVRAVTLNDLLEKYWPIYVERQKMRPSTKDGYSSMLEKWIKPHLGGNELAKITPDVITGFMKILSEAKPSRAKAEDAGTLSDKYQKNLYNLLMQLFELAATYDLIQKNPVRPMLHRPSVEKLEKPLLPREKVRDLFLALPEAWRPSVLTLLLTGMRQGELLGLRWQDIDFAGKLIYKRNVMYRGELLAGLKNTKKKTDGKPREHKVAMPPLLMHVLQEHQERTLYKESTHYVFCREDGSPLDPDHMRNCVLYPAMAKAGIPRQKYANGLHMFRHAAGSILYAATGGDLKKTQEQLGHADIQTTANIYTHVDLKQKHQSAEALELALSADLLPAFSSSATQPAT